MLYRTLGRTGLAVSEVGFGTGGVSRLMAEDDREAQLRAVRGALDRGLTLFDTAAGYGGGRSEANLGRALRALGARAAVSTKVRLGPEDLADPKGAAIASVEESLKRLGRESVDLVQIHNLIAPERKWPIGLVLAPGDILGRGGVLEGFRALRERGKVRFFGLTGLGDPKAIREVAESGAFDTLQVYYNLLNPSAGHRVPPNFSALDYGLLLDRAVELGMGVLVIRVLALGALSEAPNFLGFVDKPPPVLSPGSEYGEDVRRAARLRWLAAEEAPSLAQAAVRFALMKTGVSAVLCGFSDEAQLGQVTSASGAGGLSEGAMARLARIWDSDFAPGGPLSSRPGFTH
ncbi:MAG: aldo/keto reductase [Nitrospinota bacterium]